MLLQIRARRKEAKRDPPDVLGDQCILARPMHPDRDIHLLVEKISAGIAEDKLELKFRVPLSERQQQDRQNLDADDFGDTEADRSGHCACGSRGGSQKSIGRERHPPDVLGQDPRLVSRDQPVDAARKERLPDRLFQRLDTMAHRRLGKAENPRRCREAAGVKHGQEGALILPIQVTRGHRFFMSGVEAFVNFLRVADAVICRSKQEMAQ